MPVYSMTGYASATAGARTTSETGTIAESPPPRPAGAATSVTVELRSVNGRFLDLNFRMPDEFRSLERGFVAQASRAGITQEVADSIFSWRSPLSTSRTSNYGAQSSSYLFRIGVDADDGEPFVHAPLHQAGEQAGADRQHHISFAPQFAAKRQRHAQRIAAVEHAAAAAIAEHRRLQHRGDLRDLFGCILCAAAAHDQHALCGAEPFRRIENRIFIDGRAREGARLVRVLMERVQRLRELAAGAEPLVPAVVQRQQQKFIERWQEALEAVGAAQSVPREALQDRAINEAAAYAIRIDVAEELARLRAHLDEIERLLTKGGELGKRLDFLIQELLREANTLGSKASSLELTNISVEMKVAIEQLREQVQNLE